MKKLLFIPLLLLLGCVDSSDNSAKRQYRLRDPKSGAISMENLNNAYKVGDTVASDSGHIVVIMDTL